MGDLERDDSLAVSKYTLEPEGEEAFEIDLEEFIRDNADGLHPEEHAELRSLEVGGVLAYGGGAAPIFVVRRLR